MMAPRPLRGAVYVAAGWVLWPLRYLDRWLLRRPDAHVLAHSIHVLARNACNGAPIHGRSAYTTAPQTPKTVHVMCLSLWILEI